MHPINRQYLTEQEFEDGKQPYSNNQIMQLFTTTNKIITRSSFLVIYYRHQKILSFISKKISSLFLNNYFTSTSLLLNFRNVVHFISNALTADHVRRRGCISNGRVSISARLRQPPDAVRDRKRITIIAVKMHAVPHRWVL